MFVRARCTLMDSLPGAIFSDPPARLLIWLKVGLRLPAEALAKHILGSRREGLLEDRWAHRVMRPGGRFWFRSPYRS